MSPVEPPDAGDAWLSLKMVLQSRDYGASRRFYTDVLALPVVEEWEGSDGRGCVFGLGREGREGFLEVQEMTPVDPRYQKAFARSLDSDKVDLQLGAGSLDAWTGRLSGLWPFEGPFQLPWGQRWITVRDPDGLLVSIYEGVDPARPY
jgi:catechol 2,3-dioxygenase-like lactoylglutathione lyase family enzyme